MLTLVAARRPAEWFADRGKRARDRLVP
ncbi:protein of unknown function [Streptomyces murinus]